MSLLFGYASDVEFVEENIDMDGNRIFDLPDPVEDGESVTKGDVTEVKDHKDQKGIPEVKVRKDQRVIPEVKGRKEIRASAVREVPPEMLGNKG